MAFFIKQIARTEKEKGNIIRQQPDLNMLTFLDFLIPTNYSKNDNIYETIGNIQCLNIWHY